MAADYADGVATGDVSILGRRSSNVIVGSGGVGAGNCSLAADGATVKAAKKIIGRHDSIDILIE